MLASTQFINKLLQTKDFSSVTRNGLDKTYFRGYEDEFSFIENHYKLYGNVPDLETFVSKFMDYQYFEVTETEEYILDKLYEERGYDKFSEILPEFSKLLKVDSRDAYEYLNSKMRDLKPQIQANSTDIIAESQERYQQYIDKQNNNVKPTIKSGLPELDEIMGGWEYGDELVTFVARVNQGKCTCKGTKILMSDGSYKNCEDIKVGDFVQSYNQVNKVLSIHSGKSNGYKIIPVRAGSPFIVTTNHIMTIWQPNLIWDSVKKISTTNGTGKLIDITIEDYLNLSKTKRKNSFLYRPSIEYNSKEQKIPAYILGIWLGDGTSCRPELTTMDKEVYEEWVNYALKLGLKVTCPERRNNKACCYDITSGIKGGDNLFKTLLKYYNLIDNKHIPLDYLTGDKNQRLQLLAGLIDTDGSYDEHSNMYEICTKLTVLADNYVQLLTGLGFKANKRIVHNKKYNRDYYRITFSGPLNIIPCKLARKRAVKCSQLLRNPLISRFKVEKIEEEFEYYGFECDGDHRFILKDGVLTHNSWLLMKNLTEAWKQGITVGLYSGEMNAIKLGYRFDTLFNHFSNRCLSIGGQTDGYDEYIKNLASLPTPFKIITQKDLGGKATVAKLKSFVERNEIGILGIDQYSLMSDSRAGMRDPLRIQMAHVSEDLFLMSSEYKIPILGLAQANRASVDKNEEDAPGLENIKECDDIAANSSKVIGMRQASYGGMILDITKNREGRVGDKLNYSWDIDMGHFSYIPSDNDAAKPIIRQQAQQEQAKTFKAAPNPF